MQRGISSQIEKSDMHQFITTPRLIVSSPVLADFDDLYNLQSNPAVMTFIGNGRRNKEEVLIGLQKAISHQEKHGFSLGSVYLKNSQQFIGRAGLIYMNYNDEQPEIEVAYALYPEYWGQGYATELVEFLLEWAYRSLQITHIFAAVNPDNLRSKRVLIKSGMSAYRNELYNNKEVEIWQSEKLITL